MDKLRVLAIVGSLRKDSFNRQLALAAGEALGGDAELTLLEYADVPMMNEDIEFPAPEPVRRVREAVKAADGIWFFTPEYNHFFPGVLKNLIDWLSRKPGESEPQVLWRKPGAFSGITPSMAGTANAQDHLVALLSFLNMDLMNAPRLTIPNAYDQADEQGRLTLAQSAPYLAKQAKAFVEFLRARKLL
jgi:chromate reductase